MYLLGIEFVQYGDGNGSVCESSQESHCPMGGVAAADGNFISFYDPRMLEDNVELLYFACNILKLQCDSFVVRQGVEIPVFYN